MNYQEFLNKTAETNYKELANTPEGKSALKSMSKSEYMWDALGGALGAVGGWQLSKLFHKDPTTAVKLLYAGGGGLAGAGMTQLALNNINGSSGMSLADEMRLANTAPDKMETDLTPDDIRILKQTNLPRSEWPTSHAEMEERLKAAGIDLSSGISLDKIQALGKNKWTYRVAAPILGGLFGAKYEIPTRWNRGKLEAKLDTKFSNSGQNYTDFVNKNYKDEYFKGYQFANVKGRPAFTGKISNRRRALNFGLSAAASSALEILAEAALGWYKKSKDQEAIDILNGNR